MRIFISYRHDDRNPYYVHAVAQAISRAVRGAHVFFDQTNPTRAGGRLTSILSWIPFADLVVVPIGGQAEGAATWLRHDSQTGDYAVNDRNDWIYQELDAANTHDVPVLLVLQNRDDAAILRKFQEDHPETPVGKALSDFEDHMYVVAPQPEGLQILNSLQQLFPLSHSSQWVVTSGDQGPLWAPPATQNLLAPRAIHQGTGQATTSGAVAVSADGWFACRFAGTNLQLFVLSDAQQGHYNSVPSRTGSEVQSERETFAFNSPQALAIRRSGPSTVEVAFSDLTEDGKPIFSRIIVAKVSSDEHPQMNLAPGKVVHRGAVPCACFERSELRFISASELGVQVHPHRDAGANEQAQRVDWLDAAVVNGKFIYGQLAIGRDPDSFAVATVTIGEDATDVITGNELAGARRFSIPRVLSAPNNPGSFPRVFTGNTAGWIGQR